MPNHESHGDHAHGHQSHHGHHGHGPKGGPLQFFVVNTIITQIFARVCMVIAAVALIKIASALSLGARVKMMSELREDLSQEQRDALLDDIWQRARRKRLANCPAMPACCSPQTTHET